MGEFYSVDELSHSILPGKHKYIAKIGEGIKAKYFYTQAQIDAYKRSVGKPKVVQSVTNAKNAVQAKVQSLIKSGQQYALSKTPTMAELNREDAKKLAKKDELKSKVKKKVKSKTKTDLTQKTDTSKTKSGTDSKGSSGGGKGKGKGKGKGGKDSVKNRENISSGLGNGNNSSNKGHRTPGTSGGSGSSGGQMVNQSGGGSVKGISPQALSSGISGVQAGNSRIAAESESSIRNLIKNRRR